MQIRHLRHPLEFERCVELQKIIWGFEDRDVVPARLMIIAHQEGGLAMGAFDGNNMIGFIFSIPGRRGGSFSQHSHMLGVLEDYRDQGVGRMLKLAQYRDAVERGIGVITWTFDPLETKNAFLNLNRLGALSHTYYVNLYGEQTSSELQSGLGTDRFLAEWFIGDARTERILQGSDPIPRELEKLTRVLSWNEGSRFLPGEARLGCTEPQLLIEAPPDTQWLKRLDQEAARKWREATRAVFRYYFDHGYWVKALARLQEILQIPKYSLHRAFYLLEPHAN